MTADDLPALHDAVLDDALVARLFDDVAAAAELLGVSVKGAATARATGAISLRHAHELLLGGAVRAVQLRYRHDGREWWDTLLRVAGGVRLVRVCADELPVT